MCMLWNLVAASERFSDYCGAHPAPKQRSPGRSLQIGRSTRLGNNESVRSRDGNRLGLVHGAEGRSGRWKNRVIASVTNGTLKEKAELPEFAAWHNYPVRICQVCVAVPDVRMSAPRFHCMRFQWLSKKPGY